MYSTVLVPVYSSLLLLELTSSWDSFNCAHILTGWEHGEKIDRGSDDRSTIRIILMQSVVTNKIFCNDQKKEWPAKYYLPYFCFHTWPPSFISTARIWRARMLPWIVPIEHIVKHPKTKCVISLWQRSVVWRDTWWSTYTLATMCKESLTSYTMNGAIRSPKSFPVCTSQVAQTIHAWGLRLLSTSSEK